MADTKRKDLDRVLKEAKALQDKYEGKRWEPADREKFEALCAEGEKLQKEIEGEEAAERKEQELKERFGRLHAFGSEVTDPTLPGKRDEQAASTDRVAGYVSLGELVVVDAAYQKAAGNNFKTSIGIELHGSLHPRNLVKTRAGELLVALDRQQRKAFEQAYTEFERKALETKATPTIGSGVIEPQRLAIIPQVTADDRLVLRDVLTVGQTNSNAVSYIREESFTRAAAPTTPGSAKPEAAVEYTEQTANVRDIPVWMPVLVQQLQDWPQIRTLIDNRLLYDIAKAEEEQITYGSGVAPNLTGLLTVSGTTDISANGRYNGSVHTLIDVVRMGITDVRVSGYEPNAVLIHPYDWEEIILEKGTDNRYVWVVVQTETGPRIWGLRVVETVAMEENAGNATEERNLIVGDFQRGAALLDRMQSTVMIGLNSDDFTKNKRTILAEERVAFPIYAPAAFAYFQTQALATA